MDLPEHMINSRGRPQESTPIAKYTQLGTAG